MNVPFYCPKCSKIVENDNNEQKNKKNENFPFCSERCRLIDLGAWLDEKYRIDQQEDTASASE